MTKYFVELYSNKPINGNYFVTLTNPTEDYMKAVEQYQHIISCINNPKVISGSEIPYNNGHYAPYFDISLCEQFYQHGSLGGNKVRLKGGLEKYIGEVPASILS